MQHGECVVKLPALGLRGEQTEANCVKKGNSPPIHPPKWSLQEGWREIGLGSPMVVSQVLPHPHSPQGGVPRVLAATKPVGLGWMRMGPGRGAPSTWGRRESGRGAGSVKASDRAFRKVTPGPDSKAQRTVSAGARKRLCPFAAALRRGGGRERVRPRASASSAVSPHPPRARAGGGACGRGERPGRGRSCRPLGGARAPAAALAPAGLRSSRGAAGPASWGWMGGRVASAVAHPPLVARRKLGESYLLHHLGLGATFAYRG